LDVNLLGVRGKGTRIRPQGAELHSPGNSTATERSKQFRHNNKGQEAAGQPPDTTDSPEVTDPDATKCSTKKRAPGAEGKPEEAAGRDNPEGAGGGPSPRAVLPTPEEEGERRERNVPPAASRRARRSFAPRVKEERLS